MWYALNTVYEHCIVISIHAFEYYTILPCMNSAPFGYLTNALALGFVAEISHRRSSITFPSIKPDSRRWAHTNTPQPTAARVLSGFAYILAGWLVWSALCWCGIDCCRFVGDIIAPCRRYWSLSRPIPTKEKTKKKKSTRAWWYNIIHSIERFHLGSGTLRSSSVKRHGAKSDYYAPRKSIYIRSIHMISVSPFAYGDHRIVVIHTFRFNFASGEMRKWTFLAYGTFRVQRNIYIETSNKIKSLHEIYFQMFLVDV